MPELPEVETTCRGISPHCVGRRVVAVHVRQPRLRWPVPETLALSLPGNRLTAVDRRAKYLLLRAQSGSVIIHLGMSGSLRVVASGSKPQTHDHVDIALDSGISLRLRDPRRFGAVLWCDGDPLAHALLKRLGPEPLSGAMDGHYLFQQSRGRQISIKDFLMNSHILVGVGNIYANEALFEAGINPVRDAGRVSLKRYLQLAEIIKAVLTRAIECGGTTLRDFVREDGAPGYFQQSLNVYGRTGLACKRCQTPIRVRRMGQRSTFYCPDCQH